MKKFVFFYFCLIVFLGILPSISQAAGEICASGFGATGDNGTYSIVGTSYGKNLYQQGSASSYICDDSSQGLGWSFFNVSACTGGGGAVVDYFDHNQNSSLLTPDLVTTWEVNSGAGPAGTVTAGVCGGGGGGSVPTSTTPFIVDSPTQDYFNGVVLFFGGLVFMVYLFKRRSN